MPLSYQQKDDGPFILIRDEVLETIQKFRQDGDRDNEAGGILLGMRKAGGHIELVRATEPSEFDGRARYGFIRELAKHADVAHDAFIASKQLVHYVGEWHSHPEDQPSPSWIDKWEWKKLARLQQQSPLAMIIVGIKDLWIGTVTAREVYRCKLIAAENNADSVEP